MLRHLTIKNYALIRELEFDPSGGLNVITGETGAGKSILLGAIGLLLGQRADTRVMWNPDEKCITEGEFEIGPYKLARLFKSLDLDYSHLTVIRREVSPGGKSRAFINDTPVTLDVMKQIGSALVDIHSQHESLQLGTRRFQLGLVDAFAGNHALLADYETRWEQYLTAKARYEQLQEDARNLKDEADYVSFQYKELKQADLHEDEQAQVESEAKILEHTEEIKTRFRAILEILDQSESAARNVLSSARSQLQTIASYAPSYEALLRRLESLQIELDDIVSELNLASDKVSFDPERAAFLRDRIDLIYSLLTKHRVGDVASLLKLQAELEEKSRLTANIDEALANAKSQFEQAHHQVTTTGEQLSKQRQKSLRPLSARITKILVELGIPDATVEIAHREIAPGPMGIDDLEIMFSANKGVAVRPIIQVASGGEFARVMFAIKHIMAERNAMPTLILDEIDTGVSGEIAIQLGRLMKEMAGRHQLIVISHLPQIAARGDSHFFVFKDSSLEKTISSLRKLSPKERVEEIAKMIGGDEPSEVAFENARELLG